MKSKRVVLFLFCFALISGLFSQDRFPRPEFQTDYKYPQQVFISPDSLVQTIIDIVLLIAVIGASAWFSLKARRREGMVAVSVFSLLYFGFYRKGCICVVGSIQNVSEAFFHPEIALSLTTVIFFFLPLVSAFFVGRSFCGGACPLGTVQDLTHVKTVRLPASIEAILSIIPPLYLGLTILLAGTQTLYVLCQFDPYIALFRFFTTNLMFAVSAIFLVAGLFVARPFCRFVCPYGFLMGLISRFSKFRTTITPDQCIDCGLCETACPMGAIRSAKEGAVIGHDAAGRKMGLAAFVLPLFIALAFFAGVFSAPVIARLHPVVNIIAKIDEGKTDAVILKALSDRVLTEPQARAESLLIIKQYQDIAPWLSALVILVLGLLMIGNFAARKPQKPEISAAQCFNCARCFSSCPVEREKRKKTGESLNA